VTRKITFAGETKSIRQWADEGDVPLNTVYNRVNAGWSIYEAITKPVSRSNTNPNGTKPSIFTRYEGKKRSVAEIAQMTGWTVNTIRHWIRTGREITPKEKPVIEEVEGMNSAEYTLNNMQKTMSVNEVRVHLMRGMA